jgi:Cys-rich four helix bundle protein (predicted Tat secretion target)
MLRRDFIAGQTALLTTASTACTNDDIAPLPVDVKPAKPAKPKPEKTAPPPAPEPDPHAGHHGDHGDVAALEAAGACVSAGQVCLQHCIALLAGGDASMGDCARATADMLAISEATQALAAAGSPQLKALAAVALAATTRCAEACDKHAAKHPACKACGERCAAAATEYRRIVG